MENEMPTFINSNMDVEDVKNSDRLMTQKNIELNQLHSSPNWEQVVRQSREELLIEQSSEVRPLQQMGILIEQGVMEYPQQVLEVIGDFELNEKRKGSIKQTRDVFVDKSNLNAKYAQTKGILIEKGVRHDSSNEAEQTADKDHGDCVDKQHVEHIHVEHIVHWRASIQPSHLKEVVIEQGLIESWIKETTIQDTDESCASSRPARGEDIPTNIAEIMNEINQFTVCIDTNKDIDQWQHFRANLLTVHQYYMSLWDKNDVEQSSQSTLDEPTDAKDSSLVDDLAQVDQSVEEMMQPLNDLIVRSKSLTNYIECIEDKINRLDFKVDHFYTKYNQTLINREKAYKDMMSLQALRERIGHRLTHIEMEIHGSKMQLLQRGAQKK